MSQTHTPEEIAHFESLGDHWWDQNGPLKTLHAINPVRHGFVTGHVELADKTLLDVGCGGGLYCHVAEQAGAKVTGIDLSTNALAAAREHTSNNITYNETTGEDFAVKHPASFDVVTCFELLEHVPNPAQLVEACMAMVKPGGWTFFSTVNRTPLAFAGAIVAAEWVLQLLPKNTHHYDQFIRPSELSSWVEQAGGHVQKIQGLSYAPLSNQANLSNNTQINYLLSAQRGEHT